MDQTNQDRPHFGSRESEPTITIVEEDFVETVTQSNTATQEAPVKPVEAKPVETPTETITQTAKVASEAPKEFHIEDDPLEGLELENKVIETKQPEVETIPIPPKKKANKFDYASLPESEYEKIFTEELEKHVIPPHKRSFVNENDKPHEVSDIIIDHTVCEYMEPKEWTRKLATDQDGDFTFPGISITEQEAVMKSRPLGLDEQTFGSRRYFDATSIGNRMLNTGAQYERSVSDSKNEWGQSIKYDDREIRIMSPKLGGGNSLFGEAAVIRMMQYSGDTVTKSFPLYHSGFWVTIKSPGESRLLNFRTQVNKEKITLGRELAGAVFSNEQIVIDRELMKLFTDSIVSTSLQNDGDILSKIKIQDLDTIAHGLASVIWPDGYYFSRAVISPDAENDAILTGKINVENMLWVNRKAFPENMAKHLIRRKNASVEDTAIKRYQEVMSDAFDREVKINKYITVIIGSPTIKTHLDHGAAWIESCISAVDDIFTLESEEEDRNNAIFDHARATILCKYSHFVKKIIFSPENEEEKEYTDMDTILAFLKQYSSAKEVREKIQEEIYDFIEDSTLAIMGVPVVPEEYNMEGITHPNFPRLIPINGVYTFFVSAMRRTSRLQNRA